LILNPTTLIESFGLLGVFVIIFAESGLFFGFFLPGDSLLFTAGFLASQHLLLFWPLFIGSMAAAILGDSVGYSFGKKIGPQLFKRKNSRFFKQEYIDRAEIFFESYGGRSLILARFTPIIRTFVPIVAGIGKMRYRYFLPYNVIGGILWVGSLIVLGFFLGKIIPNIDHYLLPIIVLIIAISIIPTLIEIWKSRTQK
jgi:membrane-associated protein